MVIVRGYLDGKEVYNKECFISDINIYAEEALNSWETIDDCGFIEVEVEDENGYIWHP